MGNNPHVLMIPYPVKGHVIPMMELAHCLAKSGCKITFVNAMVNATGGRRTLADQNIHLVSIPDGIESKSDLKISGKLSEAIFSVMPLKVEELIRKINGSEEEGIISCLIADQSLGWAMEVGRKMGVKAAAFLPAAAAVLVLGLSIPKLIDDGVINSDGTPRIHHSLQFQPTMPIMNTSDFVWCRAKNPKMQKIIFNIMQQNNKTIKSADYIICNSSYDLEPGAFSMAPNILPIGPLLSRNSGEDSAAGGFWEEDLSCLEWLEGQRPKSVIYIAFGSIAGFSQAQFKELAMGIELCNRPFLWVVRPDTIHEDQQNEAYIKEFSQRVAPRGKMVNWAPQQKVLSHPSVAGFLSHCGWNSAVESLSNGVPILCWPYFADQFINQSYICDIWKIGLRLEGDGDNGIIFHEEIQKKVDQLLSNGVIRDRALKLKEMVMSSLEEGGRSFENFEGFSKWVMEQKL